jgi:pyruvate dehydrogenase E2 component (dihydrolipoamide acetyltransferase)
MSLVEVKVPDIGDFKDVQIIEVLVKPGDTIKAEQSLITVESDKASMEIPCSHAGVVKELKVKVGDKVSEGSLVLWLEASGEPAASPAPASAVVLAAPATAPVAAVPAAVALSSSVSLVEVLVPDIGDFDSVAVIEVFVKPGDTIQVEQSLITVESDKASMEIPSSHAGIIKEVKVKLGDKVSKGSLLALVEVAGAAGAISVPASAAVSPGCR